MASVRIPLDTQRNTSFHDGAGNISRSAPRGQHLLSTAVAPFDRRVHDLPVVGPIRSTLDSGCYTYHTYGTLVYEYTHGTVWLSPGQAYATYPLTVLTVLYPPGVAPI